MCECVSVYMGECMGGVCVCVSVSVHAVVCDMLYCFESLFYMVLFVCACVYALEVCAFVCMCVSISARMCKLACV